MYGVRRERVDSRDGALPAEGSPDHRKRVDYNSNHQEAAWKLTVELPHWLPQPRSTPDDKRRRRVRSIPDTWATVHSEHIGNTLGPKGFSIGSRLHLSDSSSRSLAGVFIESP